MEAAQVKIVRVGPSLGERISRRRKVETRALKRLRKYLERGTAPEPWADIELPAALLLADVCDALGLSEAQRCEVLGKDAVAFLEAVQTARVSA